MIPDDPLVTPLQAVDAQRGGWRSLGGEHKFLLFVLGFTAFFDGFDRGIIQVALPQIRQSFDLSQGEMSFWLMLVYLGALPALFLTRAADKTGRKQLLVISIVGYMTATAVTALAPTIETFVAAQFVARLFLNAEHALVLTLAAEELPARVRGFGFGYLAAQLALGFGTGSLVYGGLFEPNGIGWQWMYVLSLPPLFAIGWLRRRLPESRRFEVARDGGHLASDWRQIFVGETKRWLILLCTTAFLLELATHAGVFTVDFLQEDRGLSATSSNVMLVLAGIPAIPVMLVAGNLSDRFGRRKVGCTLSVVAGLGAIGFFWLPGGVPVLYVCMTVMLAGQLGAGPVLATYATELFPTAMRSQAGSWGRVAAVGGQAASFGIGGALISLTGGLPGAASILMLGPFVAVILFAVCFPDTHGRELEDTSRS
ncbi:MAG: MFS transporter [Acidimicrobiales bacterium]